MHIVLTGRTGSGKSTVAKQLAEDLKLPLISSGKIARELSDSDPATDLAIKQGAMAPEQAMRFEVRRQLEAAEVTGGGWVLDGFPRMTSQLICLMQWTNGFPSFFHLALPEWTCIERLLARERSDDNPDSIARKLESFELHTRPMLETLENGGVLHEIRYGGMEPWHAVENIKTHLGG